jgi:hypothetical protein
MAYTGDIRRHKTDGTGVRTDIDRNLESGAAVEGQ